VKKNKSKKTMAKLDWKHQIWKNHKGQFSTHQILKDKIIYKKNK
jgi:hypothetical protein